MAELDALERFLGTRPDTVEGGRVALEAAVVAGRYDATDLLPYAWTRCSGSNACALGAMGVLATRHLPDLGEYAPGR